MALYHKHRPQRFDAVVGQESIIQTLKNQILLNRLAHAYLLAGPRGVGKTTTARLLAKAVNCRSRQPNSAEPCDACDSCASIAASRSIDVMEMDAASHTGVDNVREHIIENARFLPTASSYKIFIIDEVHMLSTAAFNALLKTLEEPPAHVMFILATTELQKLPDTIVSRCQRFSFKKITDDALRNHLETIAATEGVSVDDEVLRAIVKKSDGGARDAISLLDQLLAIGEKHITAEAASPFLPVSQTTEVRAFGDALLAHDLAGSIAEISHLLAQSGNANQFAADAIEYLRDLLLECAEKNLPYAELVSLIDLLLKRRADIRTSPIPHLPLELAAAEWCMKHETEQRPIATTVSEKKTIRERVGALLEPKLPPAPAITAEAAELGWTTCLLRIEKDSPSLASVLRTATFKGANGAAIILAVPYRFHLEQLEAAPTRRRLEEALKDAIGSPVRVEISVEESAAPAPADDLSGIAAVFGGEVVTP